eukprot:12731490-Alexandrium_andersonii.AAC.1
MQHGDTSACEVLANLPDVPVARVPGRGGVHRNELPRVLPHNDGAHWELPQGPHHALHVSDQTLREAR